MTSDRFRVRSPSGRTKAARQGQIAEFIQRVKTGRITAQDLDVCQFRSFVVRCLGQRPGSLQQVVSFHAGRRRQRSGTKCCSVDCELLIPGAAKLCEVL